MNDVADSSYAKGHSRTTLRLRGLKHSLVPIAAIALIAAFVVPTLFVSPAAGAPALTSSAGIHPAACACTFTINENGLPNGTKWTGVFMGNHVSTNNTSVSWSTGNGTFNWSVLPTSFTPGGKAWPEYAPDPARGTIQIIATSLNVNVTFLPAWTVTFTETGLPSGTNWTTRLLAYGQTPTTNRYSTNDNFHYPLYNGTYNMEVLTAAGPYGTRYVPTVSDYGPIKVRGANLSYSVTFTTQYELNTFSNPIHGGTATPPSGWNAAGAVVQIGEGPANGYVFTSWVGAGAGNYTGPNDSASITMNGPINETADFFAATYNVTFTETGLPAGTTWSVTLNGSLESSATDSIVFVEVNNSYSFNVSAVSGYTVSPASGNLVVNGAALSQPVVFSVIVVPTYTVTYTESGLASGTNWSVTLNSSLQHSTSATIVFTESNGNYSYSVHSVPGYRESPASGNVIVSGAPASVPVTFAALPPTTYQLTFTQSGLISGTNWSVTVNGQLQSSEGSSITFNEPNGTYTFTPINVSGYTVVPTKLQVSIQGEGLNEIISFTPTKSSGGGSSGGLTTFDWIIILVVILGLIAIIVAILSTRRRKESPVATSEPTPPQP